MVASEGKPRSASASQMRRIEAEASGSGHKTTPRLIYKQYRLWLSRHQSRTGRLGRPSDLSDALTSSLQCIFGPPMAACAPPSPKARNDLDAVDA
jgi:hypothetical protein